MFISWLIEKRAELLFKQHNAPSCGFHRLVLHFVQAFGVLIEIEVLFSNSEKKMKIHSISSASYTTLCLADISC